MKANMTEIQYKTSLKSKEIPETTRNMNTKMNMNTNMNMNYDSNTNSNTNMVSEAKKHQTRDYLLEYL